ncbi:hypothetical protein [Massilia sp. TN1-12]|uniref:hypothetical protein n=1 Tax=Massilia paldalensis TaxID=3377675 RepID=UPI00384C6410
MASKRDDFLDAVGYLMATPGARSDDPIFTTPAEKVSGREVDWAILDEPYMRDLKKMRPEDFNRLYNVEFTMNKEAHSEVSQALDALAARMSDYFAERTESEVSTTLLSPGQLTVEVPGKGYRRQNHIGGEEFVATSVRQGAAGKLIFVFKPTAASQYTKMEMNEVDAAANLDGFRATMNLAAGGDFFAEIRSIRALATKEKEAKEVVEKAAVYADFGSW